MTNNNITSVKVYTFIIDPLHCASTSEEGKMYITLRYRGKRERWSGSCVAGRAGIRLCAPSHGDLTGSEEKRLQEEVARKVEEIIEDHHLAWIEHVLEKEGFGRVPPSHYKKFPNCGVYTVNQLATGKREWRLRMTGAPDYSEVLLTARAIPPRKPRGSQETDDNDPNNH